MSVVLPLFFLASLILTLALARNFYLCAPSRDRALKLLIGTFLFLFAAFVANGVVPPEGSTFSASVILAAVYGPAVLFDAMTAVLCRRVPAKLVSSLLFVAAIGLCLTNGLTCLAFFAVPPRIYTWGITNCACILLSCVLNSIAVYKINAVIEQRMAFGDL